MGDPVREAHLGGVLRYALAAASLGAGLIHVTAVFDHTEHPVVATFFVLLAAAQVGWAVALALRPAPALLKAGAVLSLGVVAIWLFSRTSGLPGVPGAEEREPLGLKDGIASTLEVMLAAGVGAQFAAWGQALRLASGRLASGAAVSAIGILTAAGLSAPGHHRHTGAAHRHSGSAAAGHPDGGAEDAHAHSDAAGGKGHGQAATADHPGSSHDHHAAGLGHGSNHHEQAAGSAHQHNDGSFHADAEYDHNAPGHVHDPSHHHHHGGSSPRPEGRPVWPDHDGGQESGADRHHDTAGSDRGHDDAAPGEEGHGHDHESGERHKDGHGHDDGDGHDHHEPCTSPLPENRAVTTVQEAAQFFLGVECLGAASTTVNPIRSPLLHRSPLGRAEHFVS